MDIYSWIDLHVRSRARQGIELPPFRWRYLRHWWAWRAYVLRLPWGKAR